MEVVNRWRAANFERGAVADVLAEDVEWVVPRGGGVTTLRGIDAVLEWYEGGGVADERSPEELRGADDIDVSEERGELQDFGEGQVGSVNRLVYTQKESGEVADVKTARLVYTVRDGKIVRCEVEAVESSEGAASTAG
jgi:ketosteroid isomerase-like protein